MKARLQNKNKKYIIVYSFCSNLDEILVQNTQIKEIFFFIFKAVDYQKSNAIDTSEYKVIYLFLKVNQLFY